MKDLTSHGSIYTLFPILNDDQDHFESGFENHWDAVISCFQEIWNKLFDHSRKNYIGRNIINRKSMHFFVKSALKAVVNLVN